VLSRARGRRRDDLHDGTHQAPIAIQLTFLPKVLAAAGVGSGPPVFCQVLMMTEPAAGAPAWLPIYVLTMNGLSDGSSSSEATTAATTDKPVTTVSAAVTGRARAPGRRAARRRRRSASRSRLLAIVFQRLRISTQPESQDGLQDNCAVVVTDHFMPSGAAEYLLGRVPVRARRSDGFFVTVDTSSPSRRH
jgi:hypothetical protein